MGKKDVWELYPHEVAVIDGKRFQHTRDIRKYMPGIGRVWNREMVNLDTGEKQLFFRHMEVEIEESV